MENVIVFIISIVFIIIGIAFGGFKEGYPQKIAKKKATEVKRLIDAVTCRSQVTSLGFAFLNDYYRFPTGTILGDKFISGRVAPCGSIPRESRVCSHNFNSLARNKRIHCFLHL